MVIFTEVSEGITPQLAGATTQTNWFDMGKATRLRGLFYADVSSAANGVRLQQSMNGTDVHWETEASTQAVGAGHAAAFDVARLATFARLQVENGPTNQAEAIAHLFGVEGL